MHKVNGLGDLLRSQRRGEHEGEALLRKILIEIDAAVFAFDANLILRMINRKGEKLLGKVANDVLGQSAQSLNMADLMSGDHDRIADIALAEGSGRWKLHRSSFREEGRPYHLILLTDLTRTLRSEERTAWKRLIQVLRHEINNSLTPISSIAGSLQTLQAQTPRPTDWEEDLRQGLIVIEKRSESLHRFIRAYSEVTRLPDPQRRPVDVRAWIKRVAGLDSRLPVTVVEGPELTIQADGDQLDQLLINLVRNAIDAVIEKEGDVVVGWNIENKLLHVWVADTGPGITDSEQAFTPFYTTKPDGAGIGLPLSRQIAENHNGTLVMESPEQGDGCRALLRLPLNSPESFS